MYETNKYVLIGKSTIIVTVRGVRRNLERGAFFGASVASLEVRSKQWVWEEGSPCPTLRFL